MNFIPKSFKPEKMTKSFHLYTVIIIFGCIFSISGLFILNGCKKESIGNQETELLNEMSKIVPPELLIQVNEELNTRKSQPTYDLYLDSLKAATYRLIKILNETNQLEDFKNQLLQINNDFNNSGRGAASTIECQLKKMGLGYGIGADVSYISSIGIGLGLTAGYELERGGGAKIVYDFVNLERQIFYFSVCYQESNDVFQGAMGAGLSSGVGFTGFIEAIMGFRCQPHGIDKYAGPSSHRNVTESVDLILFFGASIDFAGCGFWNNVDANCSWDQCLLDECPDYFSYPYTNIKGATVSIGGSASAGFALMASVKESKVGICSEKIDGTYTNYLKDTFGRQFAATLMSIEMTILLQPISAALAYFYGFYDPCLCPNSPPNQPYNPSPTNGAVEQDVSLTLSWNCTDPDGDLLTYDIYSGPNGQLIYQGSNQQPFLTLNNLEGGTNYTWQVNAKDDKNEITEGPLWVFRTSGQPNHAPTLPYDPNPPDYATGIVTTITLSWNCYDPDNDPLRYHIYFGTEPDPVLIQSNVAQNTYPIVSLQIDTKYYWKIVAEDDHNHFATGPIWSFTTVQQGGWTPCPGLPTIQHGGVTYNTVQIADQCWLRENLNYQTGNSWCYNNSLANCAQYGRLYNYASATSACPSGWHLPTDKDWKTLEVTLGMPQEEADLTGWRGTDQGTQLKEGGSSGFEALMGGTYNLGFYNDLGTSGYFWSSTQVTSTNAWARILNVNNSGISRYQSIKDNGFSVRCLKDN